ncbi:MAG: hypothetical protein H0T91_01035 [Propionibacteriaceae bacterium]|nr:hypothetical protein [Propionibacteriaceae bacterium]
MLAAWQSEAWGRSRLGVGADLIEGEEGRLAGHAVLGQRLILIDEGEVLGIDPSPPEQRIPFPIKQTADVCVVGDAMEIRRGAVCPGWVRWLADPAGS